LNKGDPSKTYRGVRFKTRRQRLIRKTKKKSTNKKVEPWHQKKSEGKSTDRKVPYYLEKGDKKPVAKQKRLGPDQKNVKGLRRTPHGKELKTTTESP